jgi:hypothetical protein
MNDSTSHYYLIGSHQERQGPYDLVAMVRKIRTGKLMADNPVVMGNNDSAKPAAEWPELKPFFAEAEESDSIIAVNPRKPLSFVALVRDGLEILSHNPRIYLYTGVYLLVNLGLTMASIDLPFLIKYAVFLGYLIALCFYMHVMHRSINGQVIDWSYAALRLRQSIKDIAIAGSIAFIPFIAVYVLPPRVVLLITVPLLTLLITFYLFTPLLLIEGKQKFWPALENSRLKVMQMGIHNFTVLFGLIVANYAGLLILGVPVLFTLPLTVIAICRIYEEMFPAAL